MSSVEVVLRLTKAEVDALFGMAAAGQYEWADTVDRSPDDSPQKKTATLAAGLRAMQKTTRRITPPTPRRSPVMPLAYTTSKALAIPVEAYNTDGLAVLLLQGARYSGRWVVNAVQWGQPNGPALGSFETTEVTEPELLRDRRCGELAVESTFIWLREQTDQPDIRLVYFENLNGHYADGEAPYMCAARVTVGSVAVFVPMPGVEYADQWTLDQAMASVPLLVIDDPHTDIPEAESLRIRGAVNDWWSSTAAARLRKQ